MKANEGLLIAFLRVVGSRWNVQYFSSLHQTSLIIVKKQTFTGDTAGENVAELVFGFERKILSVKSDDFVNGYNRHIHGMLLLVTASPKLLSL